MTTQAESYLHAIDPLHPHLSDEDVAAQLDRAEKRRKAARKGQETRRRKEQAQ